MSNRTARHALAALPALLLLLPVVLGAQAIDTTAGRFDNGKMWTFEYPPTAYLQETYDFAPDTSWFRRARLGALRIPSCSASLVSPRGLVMTNHHCGREATTSVAREGENLLDNGFYAATLADERKAEEMYADQLIAIEDVTATVDAAAPDRREAVEDSISESLAAKHGGADGEIEVEMIHLYNGARVSAYIFRRYHDVRLVMAPELQIGYFGGDTDNFTYPRYAIDMTFFRIYGDDGQPLATPEHFAWSTEGVSEGDLVFVIGNPGSTSRLQTVAELEFRRDVQDATVLSLLNSRVGVLQQYVNDHADAPESMRNSLFGLLNSQKAYGGIVRGLNNPSIIARRRNAEQQFRADIAAKPELAQRYGSLIDSMAKLQQASQRFAAELRAFAALGNPDLDASAFVRGLYGVQYVGAKSQGAPAEALEELKNTILGVPDQPADLQEALLGARLSDVQSAFGIDSRQAQTLLQGRSPEGAASTILSSSALADSAKAAAAIAAGTLAMDDPAIQLGAALLAMYGPYRQGVQPIQSAEEEIARDLGRARFDLYGVNVPPDATFSLRIADGVVRGFPYNGTVAPPYTTYYGMFDRHYSHGGGEWDLPQRWLEAESRLELKTPANFVSTADIIGGNSGSPIVDRDLRVVGLIFDGNIESLSGDYIYLDEVARAVAVDARGILEALRAVYQADRLVEELAGAAVRR
jgi:hypothetical protein